MVNDSNNEASYILTSQAPPPSTFYPFQGSAMWSNTFPHSLVASMLTVVLTTRAVPICQTPEGVVATTWYTGWHAQNLPPEQISWDKYSAINYAFAYVLP